MHIIPTEEEVVQLLRKTGALRTGHFVYPNGLHSDMYLQVAHAFRHYDTAKILSVALSRKLRAHADIRAIIKDLSIVTPAVGGLPVPMAFARRCERSRCTGLRSPRMAAVLCASAPISNPNRARRSCSWTTSCAAGAN